MAETLVLMFHQRFAQSRANCAWAAAASTLPDLEIVHLDALYPDGAIDLDVEVARLIAARRFVIQFPVQWYSTPPLLKAWQDAVLTRMFYINPTTEGDLIAGRPLMVAATAGNKPSAYTAQGINLFPLPELLKPLHATANRCGLRWSEPFITYENNRPSDDKIERDSKSYRERLTAFAQT